MWFLMTPQIHYVRTALRIRFHLSLHINLKWVLTSTIDRGDYATTFHWLSIGSRGMCSSISMYLLYPKTKVCWCTVHLVHSSWVSAPLAAPLQVQRGKLARYFTRKIKICRRKCLIRIFQVKASIATTILYYSMSEWFAVWYMRLWMVVLLTSSQDTNILDSISCPESQELVMAFFLLLASKLLTISQFSSNQLLHQVYIRVQLS